MPTYGQTLCDSDGVALAKGRVGVRYDMELVLEEVLFGRRCVSKKILMEVQGSGGSVLS